MGESGYVLHWLTVWADKGGVLYGSGYEGTWGELLSKDFEELDHVLGIGGAFGVSLLGNLTWVFPIDVDTIEIVTLVGIEDVVDKSFPVLRGCDGV